MYVEKENLDLMRDTKRPSKITIRAFPNHHLYRTQLGVIWSDCSAWSKAFSFRCHSNRWAIVARGVQHCSKSWGPPKGSCHQDI